jgi:hypothetical protein
LYSFDNTSIGCQAYILEAPTKRDKSVTMLYSASNTLRELWYGKPVDYWGPGKLIGPDGKDPSPMRDRLLMSICESFCTPGVDGVDAEGFQRLIEYFNSADLVFEEIGHFSTSGLDKIISKYYKFMHIDHFHISSGYRNVPIATVKGITM